MAEDIKVGALSLDIIGNMEPLKKQAATSLKKEAEKIGRDTAETIMESMAFPAGKPFPLGEPLKKKAVASLQEVMGELKKVADEKMAELREALSMGLIGRGEFNKRGKEIAEEFSQGLEKRLDELNMQDKISPALLQQVESVKQTSIDIGYQAGESIMAGLRRASDLQMADAKEAFTRGLIDRDEFDKRGREAGEAFNSAVLTEIRKRAMDGTLSEDQFLFLTKQLRTAGIKGGDEFLAGVQHSTRIKMARAKDSLLRGFIDPAEFEKRGREAAGAANTAILDEIRRRAAAGTLKSKDFLALSDALKDTGAKGGKQFGQEATKGAKSALGDLNKWLAGGFVVGALMAFTGLANRVIRMFQRVAKGIRDTLEAGGAARTVRASFESVAGSRGADPTAMLSDLRKALRGTATDVELMRRATFALNAGLPATGQQMGELANIARRLGAAVSKDAATSFQQLAEGIAKGRAQTLQELGIMTRRNDALRAWEKQTGRNSAALSEQEKVLIHLGAVLVEGREKVAAMGDEADEAATPVQQLGKFLTNLKTATAEAVANSDPVVTMLTDIGDAAENSSDKVQKLASKVGAYVAATVKLSRKYGEGPARGVGKVAGFLGSHLFGIDEFSEFGREMGRFERDAEVDTETNTVRLKTMQAENLERLLELRGKTTKAAIEEYGYLEKQNEAIKARIALLTPAPTDPDAADPDAYKTAAAALGAAFDARISDLREKLARELIDKTQFEAQGKEAAAAFNRGILAMIDQGGLSDDARTELIGLLKDSDGSKAIEARRALMAKLADDTFKLTATATDAALRELDKLEEAFSEAFGEQIPEAARAGLAKIRENIELGGTLEGFRQEYQEIAEMRPSPEALAAMQAFLVRLREQRDAIDASHVRWKEFDALIQEVEKRTKASAADALIAPYKAAFDQQMAELREQLAREVIDQKAYERAGRDAGKVLRDAILAEIEKLRASGAMSDEVYQALVGKLPGEADPARDDAERLRDLRDQARAIEEGARAALQLADAFGIVDEKVAAALQNVVQTGTSIARIAGGDLTAIPGAIAGAAGLIKGMFSRDDERERKERLQLIDATMRLRDTMEKLRGASLSTLTHEQRATLVGSATEIAQQFGRTSTGLRRDRVGRGVGDTKGMRDSDLMAIREMEKVLDLSILDGDKIDWKAFWAGFDRLQDMDLSAFGSDLTGKLDALDWKFRMLGDEAGDAADRLDEFLKVLGSDYSAAAFTHQFQAALEEGGPEGAKAFLDSLAERMATGDQSLFEGVFRQMSPADAQRLIERAYGYVDPSGSGLVGSGAETRMQTSQTVAQGNELLRLQSTGVYHLAGIHSLIAQMVSAPPPSYGAMPDLSPPSPQSPGLGGMQQMMTDLSGMTVEVHVAGSDITPGNAREVGERIGAGLSDRIRSAHRGSGASGPVRVEIT